MIANGANESLDLQRLRPVIAVHPRALILDLARFFGRKGSVARRALFPNRVEDLRALAEPAEGHKQCQRTGRGESGEEAELAVHPTL